MAGMTTIEWTEQTWNPTTGCSKVSSGCQNCYAEIMARRLQAMKAPGYELGFNLALHQDRLTQPLLRKKPTLYFVDSMSDIFHEDIPDSFIDQVFDIIKQTPHHTYQILTKRANRLPEYFLKRQCPQNVWLGVTVEDKQTKSRISCLKKIKATVRFLSIEPLLEDLGKLDLTKIDWVIVGGESGPKARPMALDWVESIKEQCHKNMVAFFFKQWGGWGADGKKRSKKENGRKLNGTIWNQMPFEYHK